MKSSCLLFVMLAPFGMWAGEPLLRFGVASDVHVLTDWRDANCRDLDRQPEYLEKALRWFDSLKVDAVVFPGDMAHTGRISELERFAAVWEKVFPGDRAADGRRVERMLVTGNHEIGQWPGLWDGMDDAMLRKTRLDYDREHLKATWKRLFHEDYELMWKRTVKGVVFIGCQFPREGVQEPDIGKGLAELARDVPKDRPFFYVQHAHPARSCYGEAAEGAVAEERSNAALSQFPNAVALSGHSHNSLCDERSVWQGAYTSIGCGSLAEAGPCYNNVKYDNGGAPYAPDYAHQRMKCTPQIGNDGRCCLFIEVYANRLVAKRHSLAFDEPLGEDWTIPVPALQGGEYDFGRRKAEWRPPRFPADARLTVEVCTNSPSLAGPGLAGKPCLRLRFPHALPTGRSRAFDYVVKVFAGECEIKRLHVLDREYYLPEGRVSEGEECLLGLHELPSGKALAFSVEPRNCYGTTGFPIRGFFREEFVLAAAPLLATDVADQVPVTGTVDPLATVACEKYVAAARAAYRTEPYLAYTNSLLQSDEYRYRPAGKEIRCQPGAGMVHWHRVEGTANFRDIGGWTGLKTGLVFRGAEPNCQTNPAFFGKNQKQSHDLFLTENGRRYLSETLGVRTDLDLRTRRESPTPDETPIPNARLVRCPIGPYTNALNKASRPALAKVMRVFSKRENYPIYFHCYGGADRTGTLAFLLEGLCGVDEADLSVDYELTTFGLGRRLRVDGAFWYASLVREIKKRPGATLQQKIERFCNDELGLTREEIAEIRDILVGTARKGGRCVRSPQ